MSKDNSGKPPLSEIRTESSISRFNANPAASSSPDGSTDRSAVARDGAPISAIRDRRIRAVLTLIQSEHAYSVGELAHKVHLTRRQLQRLFKRQTGAVIGDFLVEQRLQRAAHLLSMSDLSIKEIAYTVGYEHHSSFTRAFENRFAASPKDYRHKSDVPEC